MKVTYLQQRTVLCTPMDMFSMPIGTTGLLIEVRENQGYEEYLDRRYAWVKRPIDGWIFKCQDREGDWWDYGSLEKQSYIGLILEVTI